MGVVIWWVLVVTLLTSLLTFLASTLSLVATKMRGVRHSRRMREVTAYTSILVGIAVSCVGLRYELDTLHPDRDAPAAAHPRGSTTTSRSTTTSVPVEN
jgi:hypothetical protein